MVADIDWNHCTVRDRPGFQKSFEQWRCSLQGTERCCARHSQGQSNLSTPGCCGYVCHLSAQRCISIPHAQVLESEDEVGPTMQRYENVQNFIKALSSLGVPQDAIFSVADLESQSNDEKPRVAECVLWLKSSCEGRKSPLHGIRDDTMPASDSPQKRSLVPMSGRGSFRSQGSPVLGQFASSPASMQHRGMQDPAGVHKLMQQCTMILQEKMSVAVNYQVTRQSPGASYDAVGPVLESVLGGLTQVSTTQPTLPLFSVFWLCFQCQ